MDWSQPIDLYCERTDPTFWSEPANALYLSLKALTLWWSRQFDSAVAQFESFIDSCSDRPGLWLEYARLVHAARSDKAVEAYTKVVGMLPSFAEAYVNFANIKSFRVEDNLLEQIRDQLARTGGISAARSSSVRSAMDHADSSRLNAVAAQLESDAISAVALSASRLRALAATLRERARQLGRG